MKKSGSSLTSASKTFTCRSDKTYSENIGDYSCVPKFCLNPIIPEQSLNFTYFWDNQYINMGSDFTYNCNSNHALEDNVDKRSDADNSIKVRCNFSGELEYPSPWPQCYDRVSCGSPPEIPINGTRVWIQKPEGDTLYEAKINYTCKPGFKFDNNNDGTGDTPYVETECLWKKSWSKNLPTCIATHCLEPATPNSSLNFNYSWDQELVPVGNNYTYYCQSNMSIESATNNKSEALNFVHVKCNSSGEYEYPLTWPQCSMTIQCNSPEEAPINGTRVWIKGSEGDTVYESKINYTCKPGSQFDTDDNGFGDTPFLTTECLWKKSWSKKLPTCKVTHCLEPATPNSSLNFNYSWDQELVPVGNNFTYFCQSDMAIESETNNKSEALNYFNIKCNPSGNYEYPVIWPQCSMTIQCELLPNATFNGTRIWTQGKNSSTVYGTKIEYSCKRGSQFDTNKDGFGDSLTIVNKCLWKKKWSPWPVLPLCKITHCLEPITPEQTLNFNFTWGKDMVAVGYNVTYSCQTDMVFEANTTLKSESISIINATCNPDGTYSYPTIWPQCSATISCGIPPLAPVNGSKIWINGTEPNDIYDTGILYKCVNGSKFDTNGDGIGDSDNVTVDCQWRKAWSPWPILPKCIVTHCVDPFPIPGDSDLEEVNTGWVPIKTLKWYQCKGKLQNGTNTKFFESDRSLTSFSMLCLSNGSFKFDNLRQNWPTCLSTVHCGQPPNATENGVRTWINGIEFKETYGTKVSYQCVKGSQFDTNGDGKGNSLSIVTECMWNKTWTPWSVLPKCVITHCVDPFQIPSNTSLEESSSAWTEINRNKEYRCSRMQNGKHTQFFQYDRSKSSFSMRCLENGTFDFLNSTEHWPICLEGRFLKKNFVCIH